MNALSQVKTKSEDQGNKNPAESVSFETLSGLTGFPISFIKKELIMDGDELEDMSIDELRASMIQYLNKTLG